MVYFVSGIDTDAGKSYATAFLAKEWNSQGIKTITQKFIQTGNVGHSEDIDLHRRVMGCGPLPEDSEKSPGPDCGRFSTLTSPEVFTYPASPLLASRIDGRTIDFERMEASTKVLEDRYERVLLEGAGGLMVPLTENLLTIDYVAEKQYPMVFVSSGKLGSVNHTLLSLEAIEKRGMELAYFCYNLYPEVKDKTIQEDTESYLRKVLETRFPSAVFVRIPVL